MFDISTKQAAMWTANRKSQTAEYLLASRGYV